MPCLEEGGFPSLCSHWLCFTANTLMEALCTQLRHSLGHLSCGSGARSPRGGSTLERNGINMAWRSSWFSHSSVPGSKAAPECSKPFEAGNKGVVESPILRTRGLFTDRAAGVQLQRKQRGVSAGDISARRMVSRLSGW